MKLLLNSSFKNSLFFLNKRFNHNNCSNYLAKNNFLTVNDHIKDAVRNNKPVVALESTIITHGLPFPANYETAIEVENAIREAGAIPATIAFFNGMLRVGLNRDEIELVAKSSIENAAVKLSRRDISYALASESKNLIGGTTVSATMIAAEAANIPIFVTGGIGGVHRDFTETMDVSADLIELSKTKVAVISSGVKSILDIGKTLEYLETHGVNVCTLDESGSTEFPAFFTSKSGFHAPYNLLSINAAAKLIDTHLNTGLNNGLLIGVPIPEKHSIDSKYIENAIKEALQNAKKLNIKGKAITPYLLESINKLTRGKSLASNIELIKNNARVGAKIAKELSELRNQKISRINNEAIDSSHRQVTLIGGVNIDFAFKLKDDKTMQHKGVTQPCVFNQCLGGVARNMAESLIRSGLSKTTLLSAISDDLIGNGIIQKSKLIGFDTSKWLILDHAKQSSTGSYCSLFDKQGELILGLGAMEAHNYINPEYVKRHEQIIDQSSLCIVDADISVETLKYVLNKCWNDFCIPVWYNPTDVRKCARVIDAKSLSKVTYMSPNSKELLTMFLHIFESNQECDDRINEIKIEEKLRQSELDGLKIIFKKYQEKDLSEHLDTEDVKLMLKYMLTFVPFILLTRGSQDLILASACKLKLNEHQQLPIKNTKRFAYNEWSPQLTYFPVIKMNKNETIVNVSGAGDNTSSGIISGILKDFDLISCIYNGLLAANYTLMTHENVSPRISNIDLELLKKITNEYKNDVKIVNF